MPTEHVVLSYKFDELSDDARDRALADVAAKLGGEWWDSFHDEQVSDSIMYRLASALRSPGWDSFGEGDFPGIDGVKLIGWDVGRGSHVQVSGRLTRENAPALPWSDAIDGVELGGDAYGTSVTVFESLDDERSQEALEQACMYFRQAVQDALAEALHAGREQADYMCSTEYAAQWIDGNDPEFYENGSLF